MHTPKFQNMISRWQEDSSEDIHRRTVERIHSLHHANPEPNESGDVESNGSGEVETRSRSSGSGEDAMFSQKQHESNYIVDNQNDRGFNEGFNSRMKVAKEKNAML